MHVSHSNVAHRRDPVPASPLSSTSGESSVHNRDGSWGRSGGKRMARGSHGPFKFEPAVPPIPGSPADTTRKTTVRSVSRPTSPSPMPTPTADTQLSRSQQARLAGKGRSLDLGLGLTWAPSKVREEAVLRVGRPQAGVSATTSAMRARSRWRGADEEGRLTAGAASDVAEAFKEVLGDAAYGIFKNCQWLLLTERSRAGWLTFLVDLVDVHRFDANAIPLDGPYGLLVHVERLLDDAGLDQKGKHDLLRRFLRVVQDSENR